MANLQFRDVVKKYASTDEALGVPAGTVGGIPVPSPEELAADPAFTGAFVQSEDVRTIVEITQAAYDLLDPPDPTTVYVIVG